MIIKNTIAVVRKNEDFRFTFTNKCLIRVVFRYLLLLESNQTGMAVDHIVRFIVVQEWPLVKPRMLEGARNRFLLSKRSLGELIPR